MTDVVSANEPQTVVQVSESNPDVIYIITQGAQGAAGASGIMASVVAGAGISVDDTDPANPIVSATGSGADVLQVQVFS